MLIVQRIEREWLNCVCAHPNVDITAHWKLAGADTITETNQSTYDYVKL